MEYKPLIYMMTAGLILAKVLIYVLLSMLAFSSVHAGSHGGKQQAFMMHMQHANPVPNYVAMIKKNAKVLNITEAQMQQVMDWNQSNSQKMHDMVMSVIESERQLKQASMQGVAVSEILTQSNTIHQTRLEIIAGKTRQDAAIV
ncbi:hypothetical protein D5085_05655 [Ectothiorhodospiraceae bacterium BW-2]|nr:hypothetical protein D5085_05655 [Ectothiorhodospiraceae bacterium BW-2]